MQRPRWLPCAVGIGSNLDDPAAQVRAAIAALAGLPDTRLESASSLYRNPPLGPADQPWYVNAAACLLTRLEPDALLERLHELERAQGRDRAREVRWGPRRLDLDLLTCGARVCSGDGLKLPHPGISERNFVLFPLMELAPALIIPGHGSVSELARRVGDAGLEIVGQAGF